MLRYSILALALLAARPICDPEDDGFCTKDGDCENDAGVAKVCNANNKCEFVDLCDGQDDDNDGRTDEDFQNRQGGPCTPRKENGEPLFTHAGDEDNYNQCRRGVYRCMPDGEGRASVVCAGATGPASPVDSTCNATDDNCSGPVLDGAGVDTGRCEHAVGTTDCSNRTICAPVDEGCAWMALQPVPDEVCDGADNDCLNGIDDTFPHKPGEIMPGSDPCYTDHDGRQILDPSMAGIGECVAGDYFCPQDQPIDDFRLRCHGAVGPVAEECNGHDDDCDGSTDEGDGQPDGITNMQCDCNGLDDDNDCAVDEDCAEAMLPCKDECGICGLDSIKECMQDGAGWGERCRPVTDPERNANRREATAEVCNGEDDDCDCTTDDEPDTVPCEGNSVGACDPGWRRCTDGALGDVCLNRVEPTEEICDDKDNDCDDGIDEPFRSANPADRALGNECRRGSGPCQTVGAWVCSADPGAMSPLTCDADAPNMAEASDEICNSTDDDCDGIDDNITGAGSSCESQGGIPGECVCDLERPMAERASLCEYTLGDNVVRGPGREDPENSRDDDCDGVVDEDEPDLGP